MSGGAIAIARSAKNPLRELGFGICDGVACYRGIVTGVMNANGEAWFSEQPAYQLAAAQYGKTILTLQGPSAIRDEFILVAIELRRIDNEASNRLYIFQLFALYGQPCFSYFIPAGYLDLYYPELGLIASIDLYEYGLSDREILLMLYPIRSIQVVTTEELNKRIQLFGTDFRTIARTCSGELEYVKGMR
ncbi:MAG: hypothetical protein KF726_19125 [Anaerolineae bacterium]|nr:hypothetical protein [Anaerolineae bacterium]